MTTLMDFSALNKKVLFSQVLNMFCNFSMSFIHHIHVVSDFWRVLFFHSKCLPQIRQNVRQIKFDNVFFYICTKYFHLWLEFPMKCLLRALTYIRARVSKSQYQHNICRQIEQIEMAIIHFAFSIAILLPKRMQP